MRLHARCSVALAADPLRPALCCCCCCCHTSGCLCQHALAHGAAGHAAPGQLHCGVQGSDPDPCCLRVCCARCRLPPSSCLSTAAAAAGDAWAKRQRTDAGPGARLSRCSCSSSIPAALGLAGLHAAEHRLPSRAPSITSTANQAADTASQLSQHSLCVHAPATPALGSGGNASHHIECEVSQAVSLAILSTTSRAGLQLPHPPLAGAAPAQLPWDALEDLVLCAVLRCRCTGASAQWWSRLCTVRCTFMRSAPVKPWRLQRLDALAGLSIRFLDAGKPEDVAGVLQLPWPLHAPQDLPQLARLPSSAVHPAPAPALHPETGMQGVELTLDLWHDAHGRLWGHHAARASTVVPRTPMLTKSRPNLCSPCLVAPGCTGGKPPAQRSTACPGVCSPGSALRRHGRPARRTTRLRPGAWPLGLPAPAPSLLQLPWAR